jgi:hypothetical protein
MPYLLRKLQGFNAVDHSSGLGCSSKGRDLRQYRLRVNSHGTGGLCAVPSLEKQELAPVRFLEPRIYQKIKMLRAVVLHKKKNKDFTTRG